MDKYKLYLYLFSHLHKYNKIHIHICKLYDCILSSSLYIFCTLNITWCQLLLQGLKRHSLVYFLRLKHKLDYHDLVICILHNEYNCIKDMLHHHQSRNRHSNNHNQLLGISPYHLYFQQLFKSLNSWISSNKLNSIFILIPIDKFNYFSKY